jgi:menaquinone-dependent protoporphyrinogen oxidase
MPDLILVGYATRYGSTQEVAEVIAQTLQESGVKVEIQPLRKVKSLAAYRGVIMGAPLMMFRWHKDARRFLSQHRRELSRLPVAIFALGPVHEPRDEKEWTDSRAQLDKELAQLSWFKPVALEILGGVFDPTKYRFPINKLAGAEPASDIRDWDAIREWARDAAEKLGSAAA